MPGKEYIISISDCEDNIWEIKIFHFNQKIFRKIVFYFINVDIETTQ